MLLSLFFALQTTTVQPDPEETRLKNRVLLSDWIVVGEVTEIEDATGSLGTEHDPDWHWATVSVKLPLTDNILKAPEEFWDSLANRTHVYLKILFANSDDIQWFGCPKFRVGQDGIWILSLRELDNFNELEEGARYLVVVDATDLQPEEKLEKIKGFIDELTVQ